MKSMNHSQAAKLFIKDEARTNWHDETLWWVRKKRDLASEKLPEWEQLRHMASNIKGHTLSHLDTYLETFERNALSKGVKVHWAADAAEHNKIILDIIKENKVKHIVKSKSMLTEECHLNDFLQQHGHDILDTDLGEYIVQLRKETPSHIVLPAIHLNKKDVSDTFHEHLQTEAGNTDPEYLTRSARYQLRKHFVAADLAITGVNFAVAETGAVVVCTNEGNADMGAHAAPIHVACMGIEKIIPGTRHLGVFLRLLARSATGQAITTYSSHFSRPTEGRQMHVVIVDNGRSKQLGRPEFRNSLKCIRCAACFNTCPVYRKSGGHSYHSTVAGPIGAILNPNLDMEANADLPFASTLCGSCSNVCPVRIDIHQQLWTWRQKITEAGYTPPAKSLAMRGMAWTLSHPRLFRIAGALLRGTLLRFPGLIKNRLNVWHHQREMPEAPKESFREWYKKNN
jgi:L-lactate dehydrogenase complex protein LldF